MRPFFKDDDFNFLTEIALGSVYRQAADVGEVLTTVDRIHDGKARSWVEEWTATADRLAQEASASAAAGHTYSAAGQYLRASLYYSVATYSADGTGDPALFASLWEKHRAAWDQFVDLGDFGGAPAERIEIPYEGTTLPGYFFRSSAAGKARRTLIFNNGSDGSVVGAWTDGIAYALARGWNAMTFDGPGQNAALVRQGLAFRPDWEKVITPVAMAQSEASRLALPGSRASSRRPLTLPGSGLGCHRMTRCAHRRRARWVADRTVNQDDSRGSRRDQDPCPQQRRGSEPRKRCSAGTSLPTPAWLAPSRRRNAALRNLTSSGVPEQARKFGVQYVPGGIIVRRATSGGAIPCANHSAACSRLPRVWPAQRWSGHHHLDNS